MVTSVLAASLTDTASTDNTDVTDKLSCDLASLKDQYADIFEPPAGLPPDRGIEHVILCCLILSLLSSIFIVLLLLN